MSKLTLTQTPHERKRHLAALALLALIYFAAGKLGLSLAVIHPSASAVWPPAGIALAALLMLGYRVWPGIFLGAFLVNATTFGSIATSIAIAIGNTSEALVGAWLINRFARGRDAFLRAQNTFAFAILAGLLATAVSPAFGVTSLALGGFALWSNYGPIWLTWWLGDAVGVVVVAPLIILWSSRPRLRGYRIPRLIEAALMLACLVLVAELVFGESFVPGAKNYPLEFLCIPLVIWAAFRFGGREAVSAIFLLSGIAIWGTLRGLGPFVARTQNQSLLILQMFLAVLAVMGLVLAAAVAERKRVAKIFGLAVESAPNGMVMVDRQGKIVLVNNQAAKMFGYEIGELVGQSVEVLVPERFRGGHPEHRMGFSARPEARPMGAGRDLYAVRKDGSEFPVEIGLNPIETEEGFLVLSAIVDITERKRAEEEIRRFAVTDPLTGLANYRRLIDAPDSEVRRFGRTSRSFAVLLLDLDGLKKINDAHGHLVGSRALCRLAAVLRTHSRDTDTAARYGGDEFALILPESEEQAVWQVARRISERLAADGEQPPVSVSIGVALCPHDGVTAEELLGAADRSLYDRKRRLRPDRAARLPGPRSLADK